MQSHEIDYKIIGHDVQLVEIALDPQEVVIADAGAMLYMEDGIDFTTRMGDGSNPSAGLFDKLLAAGSRVIVGESLFITHFTNRGWGKKYAYQKTDSAAFNRWAKRTKRGNGRIAER